jgi:hypothetical protein
VRAGHGAARPDRVIHRYRVYRKGLPPQNCVTFVLQVKSPNYNILVMASQQASIKKQQGKLRIYTA